MICSLFLSFKFFSFRDKARRLSVRMIKWVWADLDQSLIFQHQIKFLLQNSTKNTSFYKMHHKRSQTDLLPLSMNLNLVAWSANCPQHNCRRAVVHDMKLFRNQKYLDIHLMRGWQTLSHGARVRVQSRVWISLSECVVCKQRLGHVTRDLKNIWI